MSIANIQSSTETDSRVRELYRYQILNTPSEEFFRNIVELTAKLFNATLGIISFVDDKNVYYKEVVTKGQDVPDFTGASIPVSQSPCAAAIHRHDVTVLCEYPEENDPLWEAYHVQVTKFGLKFYAGTPVKSTRGINIGMLALVDREARAFNDKDKDILRSIAKIVTDALELRLISLQEICKQKKLNEELTLQNEKLEFNAKIIAENTSLIFNLNRDLQISNNRLEEANDRLTNTISVKSLRLQNAYKALIRSQKELDTLIYNASHALRNPLVTIDGLITLARMEANTAVLHYLTKISDCTDNMHTILKRLTLLHEVFNQPKSKRNLQLIGPAEIHSTIDTALALFRDPITRKGIDVTVNINDDVSIVMNPSHFYVIVRNLVENAVNFQIDTALRSEGDKSRIEISAERLESSIAISCRDNGEGIPRELQSRVFDMFYRASTKSGGGLGLYVVKKIVEKSNGSVQLFSEKGKYALFRVTLPFAKGQNRSSPFIGPRYQRRCQALLD